MKLAKLSTQSVYIVIITNRQDHLVVSKKSAQGGSIKLERGIN